MMKHENNRHGAKRFSLMKGFRLGLVSLMVLYLISCNENDYVIEYQDGYPNKLAGNWRAFEFQGGAFDMSKLSDEYDLVTALDPNSNDSLVIDNIYNSGVRVKTFFKGSLFYVADGRQLEVINQGQYGIYRVSVDGELLTSEEDGDYLVMTVGLYDQYAAVVDTVLIYAFRKTGFEDVDYQSLLTN
jgi:hypothetical protein